MMRLYLSLTLLLVCLSSSAQLTDQEIYDRKGGRLLNDTSYIYSLPYLKGTRHLFIQGANSKYSHQNELSYDFKMKQGSMIAAARPGIVIETKSDSKTGGLKPENLADGNHIIIQHSDGSIAKYWHLQFEGVLVNKGDTVQQGQAIGLSGNTGYSAFPHLHFQVFDKNNKNILVRFQTKHGVKYIRPGRSYKSV